MGQDRAFSPFFRQLCGQVSLGANFWLGIVWEDDWGRLILRDGRVLVCRRRRICVAVAAHVAPHLASVGCRLCAEDGLVWNVLCEFRSFEALRAPCL